ncbi:hypothetical protein NEMBOFW57_000279 [Staphylotrichum longicolle]|uniref:Uncharacterized protein n=1 Tax=Staphylotrichum longicolle TaxID=669026 RepID=A0AAD4I1H9_9PEZI|nr:hypothetical protein NEMBOFW57_000279 [Staphylotrichum longicolle]
MSPSAVDTVSRARGPSRLGDHPKPLTRTLRFAPDFHSRQWTTLDLPRLCFNMTVSGSRVLPDQSKSEGWARFWSDVTMQQQRDISDLHEQGRPHLPQMRRYIALV